MNKKFFYIKNNVYLCHIKNENNMEHLDIKKILETYNISAKDAANIMFPNNDYPMNALNRILKGDSQVNCRQIAALAAYIGVPVGDLFLLDKHWKGSFEDGAMVLVKDDLRVVLNNSVLTVFKGPTQLAYEYVQSKIIPVSEFINHIEQLIKTNNNEECNISHQL